MPGRSQVVGGVNVAGLIYVVGVFALAIVPLLLRRGGSAPDQPGSDSDDGGGGGRGPRPPDTPPDAPRGGAPLEHAEPARVRLRDHRRLADLLPSRPRRTAPPSRPVQPFRRPVRPPERRPVRR